jgi:hypothetical protein
MLSNFKWIFLYAKSKSPWHPIYTYIQILVHQYFYILEYAQLFCLLYGKIYANHVNCPVLTRAIAKSNYNYTILCYRPAQWCHRLSIRPVQPRRRHRRRCQHHHRLPRVHNRRSRPSSGRPRLWTVTCLTATTSYVTKPHSQQHLDRRQTSTHLFSQTAMDYFVPDFRRVTNIRHITILPFFSIVPSRLTICKMVCCVSWATRVSDHKWVRWVSEW